MFTKTFVYSAATNFIGSWKTPKYLEVWYRFMVSEKGPKKSQSLGWENEKGLSKHAYELG